MLALSRSPRDFTEFASCSDTEKQRSGCRHVSTTIYGLSFLCLCIVQIYCLCDRLHVLWYLIIFGGSKRMPFLLWCLTAARFAWAIIYVVIWGTKFSNPICFICRFVLLVLFRDVPKRYDQNRNGSWLMCSITVLIEEKLDCAACVWIIYLHSSFLIESSFNSSLWLSKIHLFDYK